MLGAKKIKTLEHTKMLEGANVKQNCADVDFSSNSADVLWFYEGENLSRSKFTFF